MGLTQPPFATGLLDRDAATRTTPEQLQDAWADPEAMVLRLRGNEVPIVRDSDEQLRLAWVRSRGTFTTAISERSVGAVFLGRIDAAPVFAVAEQTWETLNGVEGDECRASETWRHPFEIGSELAEVECEAIAVASALLHWHEAEEFSPRDGVATTPELGGWARREARGGELFPRTDPAVIVLIEHEGKVLLGSNALWESGRFSLLAGFVEAGESLEQTVLREVYEEAGVRLENVTFVASQPWPFPRSLMVGFRAQLKAGSDPEDLRPDAEEISELRWFSREELRHPAPGIRLPMPMSIARWMIDRWIDEEIEGV
ncbi:NAD(+) diphosphatase [Leucobacter coleopterorum]|uniref:NAD(+) diphosphatase n=1 Tax=Leucobacter coleopterorum TaxID=2714933 RepID=A0ABX6K0I7_9MICO|nr:NAD(+) diphosphatase [Leucobacter coleopterorum]QIM18724.1 NAD(+) diphosphatase [Leucobacter coleopterorum]